MPFFGFKKEKKNAQSLGVRLRSSKSALDSSSPLTVLAHGYGEEEQALFRRPRQDCPPWMKIAMNDLNVVF